MAGHSKFKNIMYRKGAQDKKRSAMFSKLAREITVAAKMGLPDPDCQSAPARRGHRRARPVDAQGQYPAGDRQGDRRRRRELRGDPLRRLRPGRRRSGGRGADRQSQPHRHQRAHHLLEEWRQSRRVGRGHPRLLAGRPDRLSGFGRRLPRCVFEAAIEAGAEDVESDEESHEIWTAHGRSARGRPRARSGARRSAESVGLAWRPQTSVEVAERRCRAADQAGRARSRRMTTSRPSGAITKCPKR